MIVNSSFRRLVGDILVGLWMLWSVCSIGLLILSGMQVLLISYCMFLVISFFVFTDFRTDAFAPRSFLFFAMMVGFGGIIPVAPFLKHEGFDAASDEFILSRATILVVFTMLGLLFGVAVGKVKGLARHLMMVPIGKRPRRLLLAGPIVLFLILVSAAVRLHYRIGFPGEVGVSIPLSGLFFFVARDGLLFFATWLVVGAKTRASFAFAFCVLVLLGAIETAFGWKSGMLRVGLVIVIALWYRFADFDQTPLRRGERFRVSGVFIVALIAFMLAIAPLGIKLADSSREQRLGEEGRNKNANILSVGYNIWYRAQGFTRLTQVVGYYGEITAANHFSILRLHRNGINATQFIDSEIHGVREGHKHGVGGSGPGTAYVYGGVVGVFLVSSLIGFLMSIAYVPIMSRLPEISRDPSIALYANLCAIILTVLTENADVYALKQLLVVFLCYVFVQFASTRLVLSQ